MFEAAEEFKLNRVRSLGHLLRVLRSPARHARCMMTSSHKATRNRQGASHAFISTSHFTSGQC